MECDICIIGAGPAGYPGALRAEREGMKVALVECDRVGGTCLNRGCIPTKALRQCADTLVSARESSHFGVELSQDPSFDYTKAAEYRDSVTVDLAAGVEALIKAGKIELIKGKGRLEAVGKVVVAGDSGETEVKCRHTVIATGASPCGLPGIAIDEDSIMSSEGVLRMQTLPANIIIIGAGVIGCEWADLMADFGVRVTVVETMKRILLNEDRSTARAAQKALEAKGVSFYLDTAVDEMKTQEKKVICTLKNGDAVKAERIIVSVGRKPAVSGIGLDKAGVELEDGVIRVDSRGRTSVKGVWAAGDVIGSPMLAHAATHEMEVVIDNILGKDREFDHETVPAVTFVRPEIASVGILEDSAKEKKIPVDVGRFAYAASGKARCMGETQGSAKVVASKEGGLILGGSIIGAHAGDLIHELAIAIKSKLKVEDFIEVVHAHPTLSEIVLEAAADARGMALHKTRR